MNSVHLRFASFTTKVVRRRTMSRRANSDLRRKMATDRRWVETGSRIVIQASQREGSNHSPGTDQRWVDCHQADAAATWPATGESVINGICIVTW